MGRAIRWEDLGEGVLGGAVGTAAFTGLMLGAKRVGLLGELPPREITRRALEQATGEPQPRRLVNVATAISHLAFGVAAGALFAVGARRLQTRVPNTVLGTAFGALVWAASYAGWAPALDLMPKPTEDRPDRPLISFLGHVVFGGVLGALVRR